jgi:hypothetical protein
MNAAQRTFGFQLVDTSLPLDVWENNEEEGKRYLWADKLARRLAGKPTALGVELLFCLTREPMRDDEWLNTYSWWPEKGQPPILVFSSNEFEDVGIQGPETDRMIANEMVAGLAGFYGDLGTHVRKPENCPMWFNKRRDLKQIIGRQRFDAQCRKQLSKAIGEKLKALEALLGVFG